MPRLHALVAERGAALGAPGRGAPISASGPDFVSLPGYTEILSGRRIHACRDNDCTATREPTVFDETANASVTGAEVAFFSSWERLDGAASRSPQNFVLSSGRTRLWRGESLAADSDLWGCLQRGATADPSPGWGEFRPDRLTAELSLRYLEKRRPRLMFVGLGEPDEYAHRGDYAGYLASLHAADTFLGDLMTTLDGMGERGAHTTVLVTTDHGRGRDWRQHGREFPESARVWLAAIGAQIQARGLVPSTRGHRLADIAPTIRRLLALPADPSADAGAPLEELLGPSPVAGEGAMPLATTALGP
jgi:hypothetical protein